MNLQYALDTLKAKLVDLERLYNYALTTKLPSTITWYYGQVKATRYAIGVLEAAMEDSK